MHFNNLITSKLTVFAFESQSIYLPPSSSLNLPGTFLFLSEKSLCALGKFNVSSKSSILFMSSYTSSVSIS